MSRLYVPGSPSALRRRGCKLQEDFHDADTMARKRWTLVGAPTVNDGITLNGTTQYATKVLEDQFYSDEISIVCEFWPDFEYDENVRRYLFDTTAGALYSVVKDNNAGGNVLIVTLGNTAIASIPSATYSGAWIVGGRNVLVVSGTTGDTSAWLNGVEILTADGEVWTPDDPATLFVGATNAGANFFDGIIKRLEVYKTLLTAQEASDIYNNATWSYMNEAVLHLPMDMARHDPSNTDGPELMVDGDCEAATAVAYTSHNLATLSKQAGTRTGGSGSLVLRVAYGGSAYTPAAKQSVLSIGTEYKVTGWARGNGSIGGAIYCNGSLTGFAASTSWQYFESTFTAGAADIRFYATGVGAGDYVEFDDISVKATAPRTRDISGNNNHAVFGDGSTPTTYPTKRATVGYGFDGGDLLTTPVVPGEAGSIWISFIASVAPKSIMGSAAGGAAPRCYLYINASGIITGGLATHNFTTIVGTSQVATGLLSTVCLTWDGSFVGLYCNGVREYYAAQVGAMAGAEALLVGDIANFSNEMIGSIFGAGSHPFALTPTDVWDLHIHMMNQIPKV